MTDGRSQHLCTMCEHMWWSLEGEDVADAYERHMKERHVGPMFELGEEKAG